MSTIFRTLLGFLFPGISGDEPKIKNYAGSQPPPQPPPSNNIPAMDDYVKAEESLTIFLKSDFRRTGYERGYQAISDLVKDEEINGIVQDYLDLKRDVLKSIRKLDHTLDFDSQGLPAHGVAALQKDAKKKRLDELEKECNSHLTLPDHTNNKNSEIYSAVVKFRSGFEKGRSDKLRLYFM